MDRYRYAILLSNNLLSALRANVPIHHTLLAYHMFPLASLPYVFLIKEAVAFQTHVQYSSKRSST